MKWAVAFFIFLFVVSPVIAASPHITPRESAQVSVITPEFESYKVGDEAEFYVQVFNASGALVNGSGASCNFVVFSQNGSKLQEGSLSPTTWFYKTNLSSVVVEKSGTYTYTVWCDTGAGTGAFYENYFDVTASGLPWATNEDLTPIAALILVPLILALLMIAGAITLDPEEHAALKVGLFLFSFLPFYVSLWWGTEVVGRFYNFPTLSEMVGDTSFVFIIFFILLVFYVVVYLIWRVFELIASKKAERLRY